MAARLDSGDDDGVELHEINVTPFIDVMLVLLIIFMVAAPLSTVDVAVDLPVSTAKPQPRPDKPLFLTIKADLSLAIGNDPIPRRSSPGHRCGDRDRPPEAHLPARRQDRALRRADARHEPAARRRLSQGGAGRPRGRRRRGPAHGLDRAGARRRAAAAATPRRAHDARHRPVRAPPYPRPALGGMRPCWWWRRTSAARRWR